MNNVYVNTQCKRAMGIEECTSTFTFTRCSLFMDHLTFIFGSYEVTIEDPATWAKPWKIEIPMRKSEGQFMSTHATKETTQWKACSPALAPRKDNRSNERDIH